MPIHIERCNDIHGYPTNHQGRRVKRLRAATYSEPTSSERRLWADNEISELARASTILTAVMLQSTSVIDSKICKMDLLHLNKSESKTSFMNWDRFSTPFLIGGMRVQMMSSNDSIAKKSVEGKSCILVNAKKTCLVFAKV
jgi:hypothetical protein